MKKQDLHDLILCIVCMVVPLILFLLCDAFFLHLSIEDRNRFFAPLVCAGVGLYFFIRRLYRDLS